MRALLLALAATLVLAVPAQADVTASDIASPADATFPEDDESGGQLTVSGAATTTDIGEQVDIICTYAQDGTPDYRPLASAVDVSDSDGSFSTQVPLNQMDQFP